MAEYHKSHSKFLAKDFLKQLGSEIPMHSVTLGIYFNVYRKMENDNLKNADGVVTEQDGLQIGLVLERIAQNHSVSSTELFSLCFTHKYRSLLWK